MLKPSQTNASESTTGDGARDTQKQNQEANKTEEDLVARPRKLSGDRERRPLIVGTYGAEAFHANFLLLNINHIPLLHHDSFRLLEVRDDAIVASWPNGHWSLYSLTRLINRKKTTNAVSNSVSREPSGKARENYPPPNPPRGAGGSLTAISPPGAAPTRSPRLEPYGGGRRTARRLWIRRGAKQQAGPGGGGFQKARDLEADSCSAPAGDLVGAAPARVEIRAAAADQPEMSRDFFRPFDLHPTLS